MNNLEEFKAEEDKKLKEALADPELNKWAEIAWNEFDLIQGSVWVIGQQLDKAEGKIGSDTIYGRWRSTKFVDHSPQSLLNFKNVYKAFGNKQEAVEFIPISSLYTLAAAKIDENRLAIVDDVKEIFDNDTTEDKPDKVSGAVVKQVIEKYYPPKEKAEPIEEEWPELDERLVRYVNGTMDAKTALLKYTKDEESIYAKAEAAYAKTMVDYFIPYFEGEKAIEVLNNILEEIEGTE